MKNKIYRIKIILLAILAIIVFYWIWIQSVNFYVEQIYIPEHKLTQTYKSITVSLADPITKTAGRKILQGLEIRGSIEKLIERTGIIIHEVPDQAINRAGRLYKKVFGDTGETISAKRGSNTLRQDRYVPEEGDLVVRETSTGEVRVFRENPSNEILREPMPPGRIAEVKKGAEEVTTGLEALGRKQVKGDGTVDYVWNGAVGRAVAANGKADEATGLVKLYEKDPITGKVAKDPITGEDAPFFLKKETLDGRVYHTKNVNFNNRDPEAALNRETFPGATQVLDGGKRGYGYKGEEMPSSLLPKDSTLILEPRQKTDAIKLDSSSMVGKNGELPPKMTDWVTESVKVVQSAEDDQALLGVYAARTNFKNKNGEIVNDKVEKYCDIFLANKKTLEERALEKEGLLEAIDNHTKKLYKWTLENMEDSPIDMLNQLADQRSLSAKFPQEYKDWLGKFADDPEIFSKDAFENFLRKYVDPSSGNDPAQIARKIDELLTRDGISDSVKNQLVQARENLLRENPNIFSPRAATLEAKSAATEKAEKSAAMLSSALGVTDESENEKLSPQEVAQATQERAIEDAASGKKEPLPGAFEETPTSLATTREVNEKIYQELQGGIENYKKSLVQNVPDEYKDYFLNYVEKNPGQPVTAPQRPDNYVNNLLK